MSTRGRLTRNQSLVLDRLASAEGPLSAYALLDRLRGQGLRAPLQIYRALDRLIEAGLVHRLESINAFVACVHPDCHAGAMIAFAICEQCGQVREHADQAIASHLARWIGETGFKTSRAVLEFRGTCERCGAA